MMSTYCSVCCEQASAHSGVDAMGSVPDKILRKHANIRHLSKDFIKLLLTTFIKCLLRSRHVVCMDHYIHACMVNAKLDFSSHWQNPTFFSSLSC